MNGYRAAGPLGDRIHGAGPPGTCDDGLGCAGHEWGAVRLPRWPADRWPRGQAASTATTGTTPSSAASEPTRIEPADENAPGRSARGRYRWSAGPASLLSPYVRWYRDANFSGPSFDAYVYEGEPGRDRLGQPDQLLRATQRRPSLWWTGPNRSGTKWDWGTASVATLGAANDQFSSTDKG